MEEYVVLPLSRTWKTIFGKGEGEITDLHYAKYTHLKINVDSDMARDLLTRRSTTSINITYNGINTQWHCNKQPMTATSTNDGELRSFFKAVQKLTVIHRMFQSISRLINHPIPICEDNEATISQVLQDQLTPQVRHLIG